LLETDPTNSVAIDGLIQTLHGEGADALLGISAAQALKYAEVEQEKIIQALESCIQPKLLEQYNFSLHSQQDLACAAAFSLLKFDPGNQKAIEGLKSLAKNHWSQAQKNEIVKAFSKMGIDIEGIDTSTIRSVQDILQEDFERRLLDLGLSLELEAPMIIENLVGIIVASEEERIRKKAAWCLGLIFHNFLPLISADIYIKLVSLLKSYIESLPEEKSRRRTIISVGTKEPLLACYEGLWSISEFMSLKEFYRAWNT
jgi:hypothetical protein